MVQVQVPRAVKDWRNWMIAAAVVSILSNAYVVAKLYYSNLPPIYGTPPPAKKR